MLQRSIFSAALDCSWSLARYSAPLLGLAVAGVSTTSSRQHGYAGADTKQASSYCIGRQKQQLAASLSTDPWQPGWQRQALYLSSAAHTSAAVACSSTSGSVSDNSTAVSNETTPLQRCLRMVYDLAARQAAFEGRQAEVLDTEAAIKHWAEFLAKHTQTKNDHWLYIHCGNWLKHPNGSTGPARALLQLWQLPALREDVGEYDYTLWELSALGFLTGKAFMSASGLEFCTDRRKYKCYTESMRVLMDHWQPQPVSEDTQAKVRYNRPGTFFLFDVSLACQTLGTWLKQNLGVKQLVRKRYTQQVTLCDPGQPNSLNSANAWKKNKKKKKGGSTNPGYRGAAANIPESTKVAIAAATAVASGPPPAYAYPGPPLLQSPELFMADKDKYRYLNLIRDIEEGRVDLVTTHIPVKDLLPGFTTESAAPAAAAGSQQQGGVNHQVYGIEELQRRAEAVVPLQQQGLAVDSSLRPVVPDPTRPFTIIMTSGGQEYVVAHYEPEALKEEQSLLSAQLCTIFHSRDEQQKMRRTSAPNEQDMVMSGVRMPIGGGGNSSRFGRYHGDTGPEADAFAATAWPFLRTRGRFPLIARHWTTKLSEDILWENSLAASGILSDDFKAGTQPAAANFPSPCMFGSPFTCLGITHNYLSKLHCEPGEHPFSFITWQDLLCPGSTLEVGYFWLTAGLAFLPQPGSALYIDVRLVTHRSESCVVRDGQYQEEGRYGCALFIKPPVLKQNAELWARFDAFMRMRQADRAQHNPSQTAEIVLQSGSARASGTDDQARHGITVEQDTLPPPDDGAAEESKRIIAST